MPESDHATHDQELVAALGDPDLDVATRARAEALVAGCDACAALARDVADIQRALAELPRTATAPRDMRLSPEVAARERRGAGWRRVLRPFGSRAWAPLRPVGAAFAALGLVGVVLTGTPILSSSVPAALPAAGAIFGAPAASLAPAPAPEDATGSLPAASPLIRKTGPSAAPAGVGSSSGPTEATPAASPAGPLTAVGAGATVPAGQGSFAGQDSGSGLPPQAAPTAAPAGGGFPPLTLLSIAVLAVGLVMLGLRLIARRAD